MSTIRNRMWLTDDVLCIEISREELENYAKITMELTGEPGMFQLTTACHDSMENCCENPPDCDLCDRCRWDDEGFHEE